MLHLPALPTPHPQPRAAAIAQLQEREGELQAKAAETARTLEQQQTTESRLASELAAVRAQAAALPVQVDALRGEVDAQKSKAADEERSVQESRAIKQGKLDAVKRCVDLYRQRLGLRFEYGDDTLKLIFTLIDPADHDREFSFSLHVHDDNSYTLKECTPPVEGAAQLLTALMGGNNFAGFVRTMRRKFVESCE